MSALSVPTGVDTVKTANCRKLIGPAKILSCSQRLRVPAEHISAAVRGQICSAGARYSSRAASHLPSTPLQLREPVEPAADDVELDPETAVMLRWTRMLKDERDLATHVARFHHLMSLCGILQPVCLLNRDAQLALRTESGQLGQPRP